ncbi:LacI family DNA-binding transcriptional regulator [Arthrobacter agilis]|uniref:LacI family DNA-binding transcriptional regulator n=1 Tax=Arthrobacter agilis TaxID=37921 RepID=UPI0027819A26|nr:LacI family DNA-binding transcriptional regulator [Arthrobacter agilis]MDQ0733809.1 LacI family transcriptional regulator [Arthrobacter agilis]
MKEDPSGQPARARPVTLATVARHAQVHVSTASRALSENPAGIGADTVRRVRELAAVLGYRRDVGAAGLRTGSSRLIGVLVPRLTDLVLASIYESIDAEASAAGYGTVVANTLDDPEHRRMRLDAMLSRRIDGVIIGDSHSGDTAAHELRARGVPYVLVMRKLEGHLSVTTDDYRGGQLAAEHLLALGHRRVGVIAGDQLASTGRERTLGFRRVFEAAGYPLPDSSVVQSTFSTPSGLEAGHQLLRLPDPPTAIFAVHDLLALGAMGAIRDAGKRVGEDVALIGYNDLDLAATLPVPLTSVRSDLVAMGTLSVQTLLRTLRGEATQDILLPPELVVRATTPALRA